MNRRRRIANRSCGASTAGERLVAVAILAAMAVACPVWAQAPVTGPSLTTQPSDEIVLADADGRPVARVRIDPRGVYALHTAAEPDLNWVIPGRDNAWDYREWQWWEGHPWGDIMRPRYHGRPRIDPGRAGEGYVRIEYLADGFRGVQQILFPEVAEREHLFWDVVTTISNETGTDVREYGQFFACYTPVNRRQSHLFWDEGTPPASPDEMDRGRGALTLWADRGVGHLNGYVVSPASWLAQEGSIPHCPRGGGRIVGRWRSPVLVSHPSPVGWRVLHLIEEARCAAITQGMEGNAMDYILYPGHADRRFAGGTAFSAHIRHHVLLSPDSPVSELLERLWARFEADHAEVHERARRLRE
jgi:hypothetical protein